CITRRCSSCAPISASASVRNDEAMGMARRVWPNNGRKECDMSEPSNGSAQERELWRRWKMTVGDATGRAAGGGSRPDELTLAAFVEGRLTGSTRAAVEAYLAADPDAGDDAEAASRLAATSGAADDAALAATIARAASLVAGPPSAKVADNVLAFRPARR